MKGRPGTSPAGRVSEARGRAPNADMDVRHACPEKIRAIGMKGRDRYPGMTMADRGACPRRITSSYVACEGNTVGRSWWRVPAACHMQRNLALSDADLRDPCRQRDWAVRGRLPGGRVGFRDVCLIIVAVWEWADGVVAFTGVPRTFGCKMDRAARHK